MALNSPHERDRNDNIRDLQKCLLYNFIISASNCDCWSPAEICHSLWTLIFIAFHSW